MKKILYSCLFLSFSILLFGCTTETPSFEVAFDQIIDNAPAVEPQTIKEGQMVIQPTYIESIIYHDYTYQFDGWFVEDVPFDFNTKVTSDIQLEARWVRTETFSGLLINIHDYDYIIQSKNMFIIRINNLSGTVYKTHPIFNTFTKYSVDVIETILGQVEPEYIYVVGGEEEYNIYKYFDLYPFILEVNSYYFVITGDSSVYNSDEHFYSLLSGFDVIKLNTYNPLLPPEEQDELTLLIIGPYLEAVANANQD